MELLDMVPADAIALGLYSLPAAAASVGSLCAWLVAAALAAAFGLWRIRAVGSSGVRGALVEDVQKAAPPPPSPAVEAPPPRRLIPGAEQAAEPASPSSPPKVRFTAYYGGSSAGGGDDGVVDGVRGRCAPRDDDEEVCVSGGRRAALRRTPSSAWRPAAPWEEDREMAVRRRGDLGWYRHLDMAALDGSVVRLWDGEVTAAVASPRRRRSRAGLELHLSL